MKNSKISAESSKATASKNAKAKGSNKEDEISAKDAKKVNVTKSAQVKHKKP